MDLDRAPKWISDSGTEQEVGATLAVDTYYLEIRKGRAMEFSFTLIHDASIVATATVEGNDAPSSVGSAYATAATSGWQDEADITDITIAGGTAASVGRHVVDFVKNRARVMLVVTTPGVCTLYPTIPGN